MGIFKSNKINSGWIWGSVVLKNSSASWPLRKQLTVSEIWVISMSFLTLNIVMGSSSIRQIELIVLIKINFKFSPQVNLAFYLNFSFHGLNLVFCDEKTNSSGISVSVKGFVHSE